ncbi:hypothetical protein [Fimbriiglobus ruber]|uniref:Uncharacterized protein n=1 Tax=Fimbriiglobus ruber TaxID=1908690 RepID=A0A225DQ16_9BACT|nr:hypothetical protein [Fimbriiglobus ruber]OWK38485.1 hypothetical protein FRUB_07605 [Fimbriiglobus ruber]
MREYRVTKYDPAFRDARGSYTRDEWFSECQVGRVFDGVVLTREEYQRVEGAYVVAVIGFLLEAGVSAMTVVGLENYGNVQLAFGEGNALPLGQIGEVIGQVLRAKFWCRLEGPEAFVHFGYDYYMYVGVPWACPAAKRLARRVGLFVEPFRSPHRVRERK